MDALSAITAAMQDDLVRMQAIGQNLANVNTIGYKKATTVTQPFIDNLGNLYGANQLGRAQSHHQPTEIMRDFSMGTLRNTGNPLDVVIEGQGFFELLTPNGKVYTRQGQFKLDASGSLITQQGDFVMGAAGEITVDSENIEITNDGRIFTDGREVAQLKVVSFANENNTMLPVGGGQFVAQGQAVQSDDIPSVRQGYVELPNVDQAVEMIKMIETARHFELAQRVVRGYDDMLETSIDTLLEFR